MTLKKHLLWPIVVVAFFIGNGARSRAEVESPRPNVLFLAVDDMRDWVGCLGGYEGTVHTPHLDRLAKRGILFANAHCASPKCAPSRAAIMTGMRPSTTGLYENGHWWKPNFPDIVTLPVNFGRHGYQVVGSGKIYHHTAGNDPPYQWDDFFRLTFRNDPWFRSDKLNYPWSKSGPYPKAYPLSGVKGLGHENDWGSLDIPNKDYDDALSADYAVRFLKQEQKRPFFLACGLFRPHLPWYVPQEYFDLYAINEVVLPQVKDNDLDDVPDGGKKLAKSHREDLNTIRKAGRQKEAVRAYLASISYADAQLGRVLKALEESSVAENTIIVLWSDHGWHLGEKQHWHKSTLWEEATRVPLIICTPETRPGVCKRPVSLLDLYPTLNELCDFEPMESLDGVSLTGLLKDPNADWDRPAVIEFRRGNAAVRSERFRYIRYSGGGEELYDHRSDPHEWNNLTSSSKHQGVKEELGKWIVKKWAPSALTKKAFEFDPENYSWTNKKTGAKTSGE
ncbi:sulfatase [Adhaeretor mobilis]|uniref:Choline-sulfatase n=1 Tax=Adhaeretor mobilis TaxID=1930276 RepID=A0A517MVB0_9BACT|nr:sulfatase [Adhaeretor mobilis]QDS98819.1 Choline-sulfatase [Adhaeretor mobilis]